MFADFAYLSISATGLLCRPHITQSVLLKASIKYVIALEWEQLRNSAMTNNLTNKK